MSPDTNPDLRRIMDWVRPDVAAHGAVIGMLATTFELDPTFFDADYLPTFLGLGAWEDTSWANRVAMQRALAQTEATVVMMDARRFKGRPRSLHIEHLPLIAPSGVKLHAKVLLVVQERAVRLLVGSANLTEFGYRRNREVALPLVATAETPEASSFIEQALAVMQQPLAPWWTPSAERVRTLALQTMSHWSKSKADDEQFVWSWGERALVTEFVEFWPEEAISAITIISPFWSDAGDDGPVAELLRRFGRDRIRGAQLRLLTEAAPDSQTSYRPEIPAALAAWDARPFGVIGEIQAIDPRVLPAEVGGRGDYQPLRPMHAKVVVVQGTNTTLAYIGSANFTLHGWGLAGARSNIEAGALIKRHGRDRQSLTRLIPNVTGHPVPLDGRGRSAVKIPDRSKDEVAWPTFIHDIRLVPTGVNGQTLGLLATLAARTEAAPFSVFLMNDSGTALLENNRLASGALEPQVLEELLRDQRVDVRWGVQSAEFPVNVDPEARLLLPVSPGARAPDETNLLAYYQGRISLEDIYPPPPGEPETGQDPFILPKANEFGVDITRIQSYQIREFVEALQGIQDDLRSAAMGTETAMKMALLGEVSPVRLAREVVRAVGDHGRSATAAGFQLVEILVCLTKAQRFDTNTGRRDAWVKCLKLAYNEVDSLLTELINWNGGELKSQRAFHRYRHAILESLAQQ